MKKRALKERIAALERENADLRAQLEIAKGKIAVLRGIIELTSGQMIDVIDHSPRKSEEPEYLAGRAISD